MVQMALTITITITYWTHNHFLPLTNISDEARKAKKTKEGKQFCQSQDPDSNIFNSVQFCLDLLLLELSCPSVCQVFTPSNANQSIKFMKIRCLSSWFIFTEEVPQTVWTGFAPHPYPKNQIWGGGGGATLIFFGYFSKTWGLGWCAGS